VVADCRWRWIQTARRCSIYEGVIVRGNSVRDGRSCSSGDSLILLYPTRNEATDTGLSSSKLAIARALWRRLLARATVADTVDVSTELTELQCRATR